MTEKDLEHYKKSLNQNVWSDQSYEEYKQLVITFITTIESLQVQISGYKDVYHNEWLKQSAEKDDLIESQKEEIESLKWKIAHPVFCSGICTSQLDDYCGMYMSNESCIACNSIWTAAHVENAIRTKLEEIKVGKP